MDYEQEAKKRREYNPKGYGLRLRALRWPESFDNVEDMPSIMALPGKWRLDPTQATTEYLEGVLAGTYDGMNGRLSKKDRRLAERELSKRKAKYGNTKHNHFVTFGSFRIDEVLPFINCGKSKKKYFVKEDSYKVNMSSQRYRVFANNLSCVVCKCIGIVFLLQWHECDYKAGNISPHFNLYAEKNGELILMTKDHILPRSKGGKNYLTNYQTMCIECNITKGNSYE